MTLSFGRRARLALACVALSGCSSLPSRQPSPAMQQESEWTTLMSQVDLEIFGGRYDEADRVLSEYATRNPASAHAADVSYWRALYRLDPANPANSPRDAIALLDSYLASPVAASRRADAKVLRRIAAVLDARPPVVTAPTTTAPVAPAADKAKDEELARVKDELAKANAELERIKKRLAAPKP
jgi:hypothetical protein